MPTAPPVHGRRQRVKAGPGDPFYQTARWRRVRAAFLRANPLCVDIFRDHRGGPVPATIADHIVARRDDPGLELDAANLRALCVHCHNRLSAYQRRRAENG